MTDHASDSVKPGFDEPTRDAQVVFRLVLEAMAHPGRILSVPAISAPASVGMDAAAAAISLTLLDNDTAVWCDLPPWSPFRAWLRFHCGCPLTDAPGQAAFGLISGGNGGLSLAHFFPGTDEAPETAATLIIQVDDLGAEDGLRLTGPGIPDRRKLRVSGLPDDFWHQRRKIGHTYPVGLDMLFVCNRRLAALPRTTVVEG
jgi:alpha-D-ribose 1-methylphosphonate 5-triphosphate synthase subunit PhnH